MQYLYTLMMLGLFTLPNILLAQEGNFTSGANRYFKFDFNVGPNIDFPPSAQAENAGLLSSRPTTVPSFQFKASYLFSQKFGAYANLRVDFYDEKQTALYNTGVVGQLLEDIFAETFKPISSVKPAVDAGLLYRIEGRRWSLHPSLGIGRANYAAQRRSSRTRSNGEGQTIHISYKQDASFAIATAGLSGDYFVSPKSFFCLQIKYQQPLQHSEASILKQINNTEVEHVRYSSNRIGRNLFVGVGYGFLLGKKQKYIR